MKRGVLLYLMISYFEVFNKGRANARRIKFYSEKFDHIYVMCLGTPEISKKDNITYIIGNPFYWFQNRPKKVDYVKGTDFTFGGAVALLFSKWYKCPFVLRIGSPWLYALDTPVKFLKHFITQFLKPIVLKSADKVVFNSKSIVPKYMENKSEIVYNGLCLNE